MISSKKKNENIIAYIDISHHTLETYQAKWKYPFQNCWKHIINT